MGMPLEADILDFTRFDFLLQPLLFAFSCDEIVFIWGQSRWKWYVYPTLNVLKYIIILKVWLGKTNLCFRMLEELKRPSLEERKGTNRRCMFYKIGHSSVAIPGDE